MAQIPGLRRLFRLPTTAELIRRDIDEEIAFHLHERTAELQSGGLLPAAAREQALSEFGDLSEAQQELAMIDTEKLRRDRRADRLGEFVQDVRFALRAMRRTPAFTLAAMLTLALGIGASTAMFSLVNGILLRPLGYADADRLVAVWERHPETGEANVVSPRNFVAWRERAQSFEALAAGAIFPLNMTGAGEPLEVRTQITTGNYFDVLGVQPALGRMYTVEEEPEDLVVLSHALWQTRFGGETNIVGRTIELNGTPAEVIGVMPAGFQPIGGHVDIWLPLQLQPDARGRFLAPIARLRDGVSYATAQREMEELTAAIDFEREGRSTGWGGVVLPLHEQIAGDVRPALLLLMGAVGLLLLIACANVAGLYVSRAATRRQELAVRSSLGATRGRVVRQLLTESVVLACAAGVLGVVLAVASIHLVVSTLPAELGLPRLDGITLDWRVATFAIFASLLAGILFGIAPAFSASGTRAAEMLRGSRGSVGGRARRGLRAGLVIVEVGLALTLLVGAGLLARSFVNLMSVDLGLRAERVLNLRLSLVGQRFNEPGSRQRFNDELLERLRVLPGVTEVGTVNHLPLSPWGEGKVGHGFQREDRPSPDGEDFGANIRTTSGDYFRALRIPIVAGRVFTDDDGRSEIMRFVVNDALAREAFPGEDPIGKRIWFEWGDTIRGEIIGVVKTVRDNGPVDDPSPALYVHFSQLPFATLNVVMRTAVRDPESLARAAVAAVHEVDPNQPVGEVRTMEQVVGRAVARPRLLLALLGGFAGAALILAAIGLYGVIAYGVTQRQREIGVRLAMGAAPGDVRRMIVGEGVRLAAFGLAIGIIGALAFTRVVQGMLFGVEPADPAALSGAVLFLLVVAMIAAWIPARRGARLDPAVALRTDEA